MENNMTLEQAKEKAMEESKKGYVQHVVRALLLPVYYVSDWYSDNVVASYENGREL